MEICSTELEGADMRFYKVPTISRLLQCIKDVSGFILLPEGFL